MPRCARTLSCSRPFAGKTKSSLSPHFHGDCGYGGAVTIRHMITPTMARVADMMTSTRSIGSSMS